MHPESVSCPHCGSKNIRLIPLIPSGGKFLGGVFSLVDKLVPGKMGGQYTVKCQNCGKESIICIN